MHHSGQGAAAAGRAILNHSADQRRGEAARRATRAAETTPAPEGERATTTARLGLMGVGFGPANAEGVVME
jgi:hypothetical protein